MLQIIIDILVFKKHSILFKSTSVKMKWSVFSRMQGAEGWEKNFENGFITQEILFAKRKYAWRKVCMGVLTKIRKSLKKRR